MAVKSIIDIDVHDEAFREFSDLFEKYRAALKEMPDVWKKVEKQINASGASFQGAVQEAKKLATHTKNSATWQEKFNNALHKSRQGFTKVEESAKRIGKSVWHITKDVLRWGLSGGLMGAGSLFGIGDLASDMLNLRRAARGTGATMGQKQAFDINYRKMLDPGFLASINAAAHDPRLAGYFISNRIPDYASLSSPQLALRMIRSIHDEFAGMPARDYAPYMAAHGFSQMGITLSDVQNIVKARNLSATEAAYYRDAKSMGIGSSTARAWSNFSVQLARAGTQIKMTLINGLTPLLPLLTKLSQEIVQKFIALMPVITKKLNKFITWLGSPQFRKDVKEFESDIHKLATVFHDIAKVFNFVGTKAGKGAAKLVIGTERDVSDVKNFVIPKYAELKKVIHDAYSDMVAPAHPRGGRHVFTVNNNTGGSTIITVNSQNK